MNDDDIDVVDRSLFDSERTWGVHTVEVDPDGAPGQQSSHAVPIIIMLVVMTVAGIAACCAGIVEHVMHAVH